MKSPYITVTMTREMLNFLKAYTVKTNSMNMSDCVRRMLAEKMKDDKK